MLAAETTRSGRVGTVFFSARRVFGAEPFGMDDGGTLAIGTAYPFFNLHVNIVLVRRGFALFDTVTNVVLRAESFWMSVCGAPWFCAPSTRGCMLAAEPIYQGTQCSATWYHANAVCFIMRAMLETQAYGVRDAIKG
jgi:hypothetical protein